MIYDVSHKLNTESFYLCTNNEAANRHIFNRRIYYTNFQQRVCSARLLWQYRFFCQKLRKQGQAKNALQWQMPDDEKIKTRGKAGPARS